MRACGLTATPAGAVAGGSAAAAAAAGAAAAAAAAAAAGGGGGSTAASDSGSKMAEAMGQGLLQQLDMIGATTFVLAAAVQVRAGGAKELGDC
jgi:hypothetical protein